MSRGRSPTPTESPEEDNGAPYHSIMHDMNVEIRSSIKPPRRWSAPDKKHQWYKLHNQFLVMTTAYMAAQSEYSALTNYTRLNMDCPDPTGLVILVALFDTPPKYPSMRKIKDQWIRHMKTMQYIFQNIEECDRGDDPLKTQKALNQLTLKSDLADRNCTKAMEMLGALRKREMTRGSEDVGEDYQGQRWKAVLDALETGMNIDEAVPRVLFGMMPEQ